MIECASCGHANPDGARYCNACGRSLSRPPRAAEVAAPAPDPRSYTPDHLADRILAARSELGGERKQVTVLFADVMGSMELAEQTDPEDWQRIMERFFAICCEEVHRFEGTVDKFTGDGIMALFGAPIAHEDHAARACHAALHLAEEVERLAAELRRERGLNFLVRLGLNSGEVVVGAIGDDLTMDYTALGHTVGLAQRMESLAQPGRAYLTEHTAALVEGFFDLRDLGRFEIKGVHEPPRVYELAGLGRLRTRLEVARARGFSRFVGREQEIAILEDALAGAIEGEAEIVGIVGEAGIGKSRLCYEFAQTCRARGIDVWEGRCKARGETVPLMPLLELLRSYFGIGERDPDRTAREKIAGRMLLLDESLREELPLVFDLLGVADPERPAPRIDPEAGQRRLFATLNRLLSARAEHGTPVIYLLEDLQWIDPGSEAFLENLVRALPGSPTLLIVNFRPEHDASWMGGANYRQLQLMPLGQEAVDALLDDLLGEDPSLGDLAASIRERAGGNPFFIEELVRGLVESGDIAGVGGAFRLVRPVDTEAIPATVESALAARIDGLAALEKSLLQTAAVIGREFAEPVLSRLTALSDPELRAGLKRLVDAGLIYELAGTPEAEYSFKHQLTTEVAYRSQLAATRRRLHSAIARAIEELYTERLDELAALISHHLGEAGEQLEAARWNARAAAWAGFAAPAEALRHWRRVRELTDAVPASDETVAMGVAARIYFLHFAWRLGAREEEIRQVFEEGRKLAERSGDLRSQAVLLALYANSRVMVGEASEYADMSLESIRLAEESGDAAVWAGVLPGPAWALYDAGRLREGFAVTVRGRELWADDPTLGSGIAIVSPCAWCAMQGAIVGTMIGAIGLEEARSELDRAFDLARDHADVETTGWVHACRVAVAWLEGDPEAALIEAIRALEIAERTGSSFSRSHAYHYVGLAYVMRREWDRAVAALERSLEIMRESRTGLDIEPRALALLGEAQSGIGDVDLGRKAAREAVELAQRRKMGLLELLGRLSLARVLAAADGADAVTEIEVALGRAQDLIEETEAVAMRPHLHLERAELARLRGDAAGREHQLHRAERLFEEVGATARAAAVAAELSPVAS